MDLDAVARFFGVRELLLVAAIFIPAERLFGRHRQPVLRKWWWNDLIYIVANKILIYVGMALAAVGAAILLERLVPAGIREFVAGQPLWIQIIETVVIADVGFYAAHRMFHTVPWLWRFHAVHHSIEQLDWLASVRVHPLDQIVTKSASTLPLYVLGFSSPALVVFNLLYFWQSFLVHSNVRVPFGPFQAVVVSPEFHHWHHANEPDAYNKNYSAQLSFLDRLFGTYYLPADRTPEKYGVHDPVPHTYLEQLIYPFEGEQAIRTPSTTRADSSLQP